MSIKGTSGGDGAAAWGIGRRLSGDLGCRQVRSALAAALLLMNIAGLAGAQAKPEGTMTWGLHFNIAPTFFDPAEASGLATPFMFLYALHDALIKPMPAGLLTPSLAESWTESPDGLVYDFKLREGVTFHNGQPLAASDVEFSFKRYRGASRKVFEEKVEAVEALDPHRVRFRLREPWPDFLLFLGTPATGAGLVVPQQYLEQVGNDGFKQHPIGAGPYKFVSHNPGVDLVLEANETYWRKMPHIKRLVLKGIPDPTTRLVALKKGEIDISYAMNGEIGRALQADPQLTTRVVSIPTTYWLEFSGKWDPKSPWHDRGVRLAASYAIDRQAIMESETLGFGKLTGNIVPSNLPYALPLEPLPHDPAKAKQLLKEAGYANGFDAGDITPFPPATPQAEAVANDLGAVGIKLRVRTMERPTMITAWRGKTLQGVILALSGALSSAAARLENYVVSWGEFAYGGSPDLDALFHKQARELDRQRREELLHEMQRLVHDRVMFVPIYESAGITGIGPRVAESGLGLITPYQWSGPYEDVRLKP
jgi:peptide/nickel transport system substrate-binding protein